MFAGLPNSQSNTMRGDQVFVSVIYDFEYISEEGKRVFMKENEILLLINKTNHDWWQVIRRGDRRPFYAPAKYVTELRPADLEHRRDVKGKGGLGNAGGWSNSGWQPFNGGNKNRPMFSTFATGAVTTGSEHKLNSGSRHLVSPASSYSKRHSIASPGSRFNERYRSNSLDSILIADLDRASVINSGLSQNPMPAGQPSRHSYHVASGPPPAFHVYPAEQHLMPKSQVTLVRGGLGLAKRPTIEGLDKRKSWSLDISSTRVNHASLNSIASNASSSATAAAANAIGASNSNRKGSSSRISSYQNTDGLVGIGKQRDSSSKSSVSSKTSNSQTDPRNRKKPVPLPRSKVPPGAEGAPAPSPLRQQHSGLSPPTQPPSSFFQRSKTDLGLDALTKYKAKRSPGSGSPSKYPAPQVPMFNRPVPQKRGVAATAITPASVVATPASSAPIRPQRPAVKEKPAFSTFKTKKVEASLSSSSNEETQQPSVVVKPLRRISRAASEGDILGQLIEEETSKEAAAATSEAECEIVISDGGGGHGSGDDSQIDVLDSNAILKPRSEPLTITSQPLIDKTNSVVSEWMDKSCSTSFESNDGSMLLMSSTADQRSTDVSMEEQDLFSLESCGVLGGGGISGGANQAGQQDRLQMMSPCSTTSRSPPSPMPGMTPRRQVADDWEEYEDGSSGRKFYFNQATREKSWKPPRRSKGSGEGYSAPTSPCPDTIDMTVNYDTKMADDDNVDDNVQPAEPLATKVPDGYERKTSIDNGQAYFVNMFTGVKWFSAETEAGKVYYYEENGNESCWALPNVSQSIQDNEPQNTVSHSNSEKLSNSSSKQNQSTSENQQQQEHQHHQRQRSDANSFDDDDAFAVDEPVTIRPSAAMAAAAAAAGQRRLQRPVTAMPALNRPEVTRVQLPVSSPNFQIGKVSIVIVKQGPLNKTKLVENGKKHRKNWTTSHVVLTDTFLLFFKDAKTFASMQSGGLIKPDHCIDLKGANLSWTSGDKSKRNNVFEVTTALLGITMLLQDSDSNNAADWFHEIKKVSEGLTRRYSEPVDPSGPRASQTSASSTLQLPPRKPPPASASLTQNRVNRTTSLKLKFLGSGSEIDGIGPPTPPATGSTAALAFAGAGGPGGSKVNIREKLRKFFMRRPAMDDLFRRGIMKNEPVFGSTLRELQATDLSDVPLFVKKCIAEIEKGELLKTDGVYRQSGNLSHIQKIRFQVDQGNLAILETVDDVHVLTGALKLFFRELKEPLILWDIVDRLLLACNHQSRKVKFKQMRECIATLPQAHRATLAYLLRHLVRVTEYKETNRMQIPNMAIVFGPTLMWPPSSLVSHNLALSMMQQNIIVEALLNNVETIFGG